MARTREEIEADYTKICMTLGDRRYRIAVLEGEVQGIINKLADLNKEAASTPPPEVAPEVPSAEG